MHLMPSPSFDKIKALEERLKKLGVHAHDMEETFVRSPGAGGQHVNKTSTAVRLLHITTGIEIKASSHRSQILNRYDAKKRLAEELEMRLLGKASPKAQRQAKAQKQKDRRKRRAKPQETPQETGPKP